MNRSFVRSFRDLLGVASIAALSACASGTESVPPGPPAQLVPASVPDWAAEAGTTLSDSVEVRVVDADGRGVPGHTVQWSVTFRGGAVDPRTTLTDRNGTARTALTAGTLAGEHEVRASTLTENGPATVEYRLEVLPGPTASLQLFPQKMYLGVDEAREIRVVRTDAYGNEIVDREIVWTSSDPSVASIDGQTGTVTGRSLGTAGITAESDGRTATATVEVTIVDSGADTFDDPNELDAYTQYADVPATWTVGGGVLTATGAGVHTVQVRDAPVLRDGWVESEMDRADEGGLVLRFQDDQNYYLLSIHDDGSLLGNRNLEIFRRTSGNWVLLSSNNLSWPRGEVRRVRFEAEDVFLRVYMDDVLVREIQDSVITDAGLVGMRYNDVPEDPTVDMARYLTFGWQGR